MWLAQFPGLGPSAILYIIFISAVKWHLNEVLKLLRELACLSLPGISLLSEEYNSLGISTLSFLLGLTHCLGSTQSYH